MNYKWGLSASHCFNLGRAALVSMVNLVQWPGRDCGFGRRKTFVLQLSKVSSYLANIYKRLVSSVGGLLKLNSNDYRNTAESLCFPLVTMSNVMIMKKKLWARNNFWRQPPNIIHFANWTWRVCSCFFFSSRITKVCSCLFIISVELPAESPFRLQYIEYA